MPDFEEIERESPVNTIVGRAPGNLLSYGSGTVFLVIFILLCLCFVVKYPDVVSAPLVVKHKIAPRPLISKSSGVISQVFATENQVVEKGTPLFRLETVENYEQLLILEEKIDQLEDSLLSSHFIISCDSLFDGLDRLGSIEMSFNNFMGQLTNYQLYLAEEFNGQEKENLLERINHVKASLDNLMDQKKLNQEELNRFHQDLNIQQQLYDEKLISKAELDKVKGGVTVKKIAIKQIEASELQKRTQLLTLKDQLIAVKKAQLVAANGLKLALRELKQKCLLWKDTYLVVAPSSGFVAYSSPVQKGSISIPSNPIGFIIDSLSEYEGWIQIGQFNLGKVAEGQIVNLKFQSHQHSEFGMVEGRVKSISQVVNKENSFMIQVEFLDGLRTNFGKEISVKNGSVAMAEIITEDLYVFQRIFYQFKDLFQ